MDTAVEVDQRVEMGVTPAVQSYKLTRSIRAMMLPHEWHKLADNPAYKIFLPWCYYYAVHVGRYTA